MGDGLIWWLMGYWGGCCIREREDYRAGVTGWRGIVCVMGYWGVGNGVSRATDDSVGGWGIRG